MRHTLTFIIGIIGLLSCNSADTVIKSEPIKFPLVDTIKLARQRVFAEKALKLNLKPIYAGVDSFEMRIWVGSIIAEHELIVLKRTNTSWFTQKMKYHETEDGLMHFKNEKLRNSTIALPLLIDSLRQLQPNKIISQDEIPNFVENVADGVTYNLEIATKGSYKLVTYHCPERFAKTEINNKMFLKFILLMNKYFNFWSPMCFT